MKKLLPVLAVLIIIPGVVSAAEHYVSPTGSATWSQCTNINTHCSLSTANSNAQAGDTVYLRGGTYGIGIAPARSGTSHTNRITYTNYNDEAVVISGVTYPLTLNGRSWITITGTAAQNIIIVNSPQITDVMKDASYNIFAYITAGPQSVFGRWDPFSFNENSQYNWVHHCTFHGFGAHDDSSSGDLGDGLVVGPSQWYDDPEWFHRGSNVIEDNTLYHGGHNVVVLHTRYNVFRNNNLLSDAWYTYNGVTYGSRTMASSDRANGRRGWNLIEGNKFTHTDPPIDTDHAQHIQMFSSNQIVRKNTFHSPKGQGIIIYTATVGNCLPGCGSDNNHIYHNTFFRTGLGGDAVYHTRKRAVMLANWGWADGYTIDGTVIKNNAYEDCVYSDFHAEPAEYVTNTVREGEYYSDDGDPMFADETIPSDRNDYSKPDFAPQAGSPLIDNGVALTTTVGTGSSSASLYVDDAGYFFSGDGEPWNIPSYITDPSGDYIFVEGWPSPAEIASIDYANNRITLASDRSWSSGAAVYLAVSPTEGYYGSGPDIGAIEYGEPSCAEDWDCTGWSEWSECLDGQQTRTQTCTDLNSCGTTGSKPDEAEARSCSAANGTFFEARNSEDTLISTALPENNYGGMDTFYLGSRQIDVRDRVLLRFPGLISQDSVPRGAAIGSATLTLTHTGTHQVSSPIDMKVRRVLEPWTEGDTYPTSTADPGETTWDYASYPDQRWLSDSSGDGGTDAGCSEPGSSTASGEASAAYPSNPPEGQASSLDVTSIVQHWATNGEASNHGFLLIAPGQEGSAKNFVRFASSENADQGYRPMLSVEFSLSPHRADTSGDGCVDDPELMAFIGHFYLDSTAYPMGELMEAVGMWKAGTGC